MPIDIPKLNVRRIALANYIDRHAIKFTRPSYEIRTSSRLVKTGASYYDSLKLLPDGIRFSTAAEELSAQLDLEAQGKDPRQPDLYKSLFDGNGGVSYQWVLTLTGLRIPDGVKPGEHDVRNGRKYFVRQVLEGDEVVGEVDVPEGGGERVVTSWNEFLGIPAETSDRSEDMKLEKHTTHFYFNDFYELDKVSRHYDSVIVRFVKALPTTSIHKHCLLVNASSVRWFVHYEAAVRPVQGDLPKVMKEQQ